MNFGKIGFLLGCPNLLSSSIPRHSRTALLHNLVRYQGEAMIETAVDEPRDPELNARGVVPADDET
ncbi:unnamed protein product [Prunus armeniaca]|uniref:Uncharacterized protein n=1 Tax=Prunus armeniaca TaxID=36596 RepID=A0A6J5WBN1_PRUAR|nr:unnamed protein product [Prunus armeniaca]CAB4298959.1 unnamed protein product [Prunus armeniaca]